MADICCAICEKTFSVPVTDQQVHAWLAGTPIQKAMPNIPAAERELFISNTCGQCWTEMFAGLDEDELHDSEDSHA